MRHVSGIDVEIKVGGLEGFGFSGCRGAVETLLHCYRRSGGVDEIGMALGVLHVVGAFEGEEPEAGPASGEGCEGVRAGRGRYLGGVVKRHGF